nr:uncharacterized protein LOC109178468 [Ipomoea trifida]
MRSQDPEPTTNLVSKPDVMGEYASAESVQTLQAAVTAMQTEQGEIRQMLRQLLAGKGPATDDSGSQHGSRPPAEEAQATGLSDVPAATTPKFARLEFPRFDGREDPSAWLHRCEQFFKAQNTPAREFVSLAAFHLTGVAQTWHLRLELEDPAISWRHFKQRCYLRFGPGLRGNALGMLTYVRQNGRPVEEYTDEFQEILGLTTTVHQDQEVDLYTAGLDEWLRIDVENMHPPNLDVAMNIARSSSRKQRWFSHPYATDPSFFPVPFAGGSHQSHQSATYQPHQSATYQPHQPAAHVPRPGQTRAPATFVASSAGSRPVAAPRPATSVPRSGGAVSSGNQPPERRLPRSEYQRRRASGLCFHCDERWTPAHNCRHLFLLVIDDAAPPSTDEDFFVPDQLDRPEISLHAITGTGNGNTMRVNLLLNNKPITALIDSGSTHNFVDSATAKRLGTLRAANLARRYGKIDIYADHGIQEAELVPNLFLPSSAPECDDGVITQPEKEVAAECENNCEADDEPIDDNDAENSCDPFLSDDDDEVRAARKFGTQQAEEDIDGAGNSPNDEDIHGAENTDNEEALTGWSLSP